MPNYFAEIKTGTISADASCDQPWLDIEGQAWMLTGHAARLPDGRIARWTSCDEAGIDDVEILSADDEADLDDVAREWAEEIAGGVGTVAVRDESQREHYTTEGIQYCPGTGYDRDGYREVYIPAP